MPCLIDNDEPSFNIRHYQIDPLFDGEGLSRADKNDIIKKNKSRIRDLEYTLITKHDYEVSFGKYKGTLFKDMLSTNCAYCRWYVKTASVSNPFYDYIKNAILIIDLGFQNQRLS